MVFADLLVIEALEVDVLDLLPETLLLFISEIRDRAHNLLEVLLQVSANLLQFRGLTIAALLNLRLREP